MPLETDGVVKEGSQTQFAREDISRRVQKFRHNKVSTVCLDSLKQMKRFSTSRNTKN